MRLRSPINGDIDTIGYSWCPTVLPTFAAIVLSEHFLFRSNNFASYTVGDWDNPARLPIGIAAVLAFAGAFAVIVPSMSQTEYTGPIAKAGTGDIGVLTGFLTATLLYGVLRTLERRLFPKRSS